ncbi:hypothetical protein A3A55_00540 [Candidatus Roizmanbacteria bacterium RIFCSPLOWO2_01_FULL_40_14]|uniref:Peptidase C51 domain-containing protein n=2 Tax=Candidatus Roizmaniibacteriota TaxID=1752723 RepID=A0A0G1ACL8_9BACT|nr:MAG: hypothetical protein UU14_C0021G0009 [Candidatus Roizmanbacteria bacterium GW2011_GWB1_40_7]KKS23028.1 MAG: hypothetical protein UU78_C0006G0008 [Candidatus Roizmanbacteria bacterium GW2011_GWC2_41_7]OGK48958.1 MAG: hypothetical protein A3A55_00540 [Candidatus Roizmanbacteria bacterium RIFCSPLOWO2_01_FULL_40_14]
MFRKLALGILTLIVVSIVIPSTLLAQKSASDILEKTKDDLTPESVAQQNEQDTNSFIKLICDTITIPLICPAVPVHNIYAPESQTIKENEQNTQDQIDELKRIDEELTRLSDELESGDIAGTSSAQVLSGSTSVSLIDRIKNIFGTRKPIAGHTLPQARQLQSNTNETKVQEVATNLLPEALQQKTSGLTSTPGLTPGPTGGVTNPNVTGSLRELIMQVASVFGVPWQVLEATLHIEGEHVFGLSSDEIIQYQEPNAQVPTNCNPNVCSAAGPMQFTTGYDNLGTPRCTACGLATCPNAWSSYQNAVTEKVNDGRMPNVCNLKDSLYAAAKKLKNDSGTGTSETTWNKTAVTKAAQAYYGSCTPCNVAKSGTGAYYACQRLGKTYCDYVWDYYQGTPDEVVEPTIPAGSTGGGSIAQAYPLVTSIRSVCKYGGTPGRVHRLNVQANNNCLNSVIPQLTSNAKNDLVYSANEYINLQCVGLVVGMKWQFDNHDLTGGGHAIDYASNVPPEYRFVRKGNGFPRVHDLLIWDMGNEYGHIAYVIEVNDASSVEVMEANWDSAGVVNSRVVYLSDPKVYGWITRL